MLLVDTYNMYHCVNMTHNRMIDYDRLVQYIQMKHLNDFSTRYAYVAQTEQSRTFSSFLRSRQFIVRSKHIRPDKLDTFDVNLTVDALSMDSKLVVICSSSLNLIPLIERLGHDGCLVAVHSFGIPFAIKEMCDAWELPTNVLRVREPEPV